MSIPYQFTPIDTHAAATDTPMPHDGSSTEERFSGEALISLEALTPLLVANHHQENATEPTYLAPERLPDGRVLLSASSIKGMLRSSISALLNSPMERVQERHYTYRPNAAFAASNPTHEHRAAVITQIEGAGEDKDKAYIIKLLPNGANICFVKDEALASLNGYTTGQLINQTINGVELNKKGQRSNLSGGTDNVNLNHYLFSYKGGIDGGGKLAKAFKSNSFVYSRVLVSSKDYDQATEKPLPTAVVKQYFKTQAVLANSEEGHLMSSHPNVNSQNLAGIKESIKENTQLEQNQLIYVEIDSRTEEVTSFGHHFHYRWAYTSSIKYKGSQARAELSLLPEEKQSLNSDMPAMLAANRLLFGYTLSKDQEQLAQNNWQRLAGRISPNTALEVIDPAKAKDDSRFLDEGKGIVLQVLGQPRPSAVETYVSQPSSNIKKLNTYGDTPADVGSDLSGRKSYKHQGKAKADASTYKNQSNEQTNLHSKVFCVSKPETKFKFSLRFSQLRSWELGALLATLQPSSFAKSIGATPTTYAHKLGYAKPLGFGSVELQIDKLRYRKDNSWDWQQLNNQEDLTAFTKEHFNSLKPKLNNAAPLAWANSLKFVENVSALKSASFILHYTASN